MGKFVISKRSNGEYQFNLKALNGQVILTSEGYKAKASCLNGIESVKRNSQSDSKFERKTSKNNKYYFTLKSGNGQVIGMSEMYDTGAACENGVRSVMTNAANAGVEEAF